MQSQSETVQPQLHVDLIWVKGGPLVFFMVFPSRKLKKDPSGTQCN